MYILYENYCGRLFSFFATKENVSDRKTLFDNILVFYETFKAINVQ